MQIAKVVEPLVHKGGGFIEILRKFRHFRLTDSACLRMIVFKYFTCNVIMEIDTC